MQLPPDRIAAFRAAWQAEFREEIDEAQADERLRELVELVRTLSAAPPHSNNP